MGASVTHTAVVPVDVVKTRIQLFPEIYNKGMVDCFKQIIAKEGAGKLLSGWAPTASGYFLQGALKFGGYEFFKKQFVEYLGPQGFLLWFWSYPVQTSTVHDGEIRRV